MQNSSSLSSLLTYVAEHSQYYKNIFKDHAIDINSIKSQEDLVQLPFTTKDNLALNNEDFLCVPKSKIVDYVSTSGTLSNPVAFYLTQNDLDRLAANEKKSFELIGASSDDVFQMMVTMDKQFMAGLAYFLGIKAIKAGMIRQGPGSPKSQLDTILKFKPTVLIAIPSFIVKLTEYAKEHKVDLNDTSVKTILCIGEALRDNDFNLNELGKRIKENWDINLHSTYASTEIGAAFTECSEGKGGHLNPDLLILEVVDESGNAVKDGELGEVVVTTLGVEGMPLLRYKTGDLCVIHYTPCTCGSSTPRLGPVVGRKQQMIKYKGTTIFPPSIFEVLVQSNINLFQVSVEKDQLGVDDVIIKLPNELDNVAAIKKLKSDFKSKIRVTPKFDFLDSDELKKLVFPVEKRKPQTIVFKK